MPAYLVVEITGVSDEAGLGRATAGGTSIADGGLDPSAKTTYPH